MSFAFLAPLFLVGAAAIAIPIIVHLTHKEKKDPVPFPSLMFLRRVPFRTSKKQRIRNWLLFLMRVTALGLVVAAFARPLLDSSGLGLAVVGQSREVVVLLDRSYSMTHGERWDRATEAAEAIIDELGPNDRASLFMFADRAEAVAMATSDPVMWRAAIARVRPGGGRTQLGPAIQAARDVLEVSELAIRELVLITDFQRSAWDGADAVRMPAGTRIREVDLGDANATNLAVAGVLIDRAPAGGRDQVRVTARVVNPNATPADIPVSLDLDGVEVDAERASVPPQGAAVVTFTTQMVPDRAARGRVSLDADDVEADNVFHFVVAPIQPVRLMVVTSPASRASDLLYLQQALAVGDNPPHAVTTKRVSDLRDSDFLGMDGFIWMDAPPPQGQAAEALTAWIGAGGGMLVVLGPRTGPGAWPPAARALLGGDPGGVVDRVDDRGATLSVLSYEHPVFEPFAAPRSGDFSVARFLRYRAFTPRADSMGDVQRMLVRYDDGAPALFEHRVGRGRVLVWTGGAANQWNDLPLKPVFLPFVHQIARYLASYRPEPSAHIVGQVAHVAESRLAGTSGDEIVIESPSGDRNAVAIDGDVPVSLDQAGFFVARRLQSGTTEGVVLASNPDPQEADLSPIPAEEVLLALQPDEAAVDRPETLAASLGAGQKERRQALWWYLLIVAVFILLAESVIAHRTVSVVR